MGFGAGGFATAGENDIERGGLAGVEGERQGFEDFLDAVGLRIAADFLGYEAEQAGLFHGLERGGRAIAEIGDRQPHVRRVGQQGEDGDAGAARVLPVSPAPRDRGAASSTATRRVLAEFSSDRTPPAAPSG